jgi:alcohol dehydrogenase (cytochrome c)
MQENSRFDQSKAIVALDVKSGRVVRDQPLTEERGFMLTGGPLVAKGKGMIGTGGRVGGNNYIVALDAGEPGGDTWNDHTAEERNGASVWVAGSYDSALALFGVAQTYDTALLAKPVRPSVKTDGLYIRTAPWLSIPIPASSSGTLAPA